MIQGFHLSGGKEKSVFLEVLGHFHDDVLLEYILTITDYFEISHRSQ